MSLGAAKLFVRIIMTQLQIDSPGRWQQRASKGSVALI